MEENPAEENPFFRFTREVPGVAAALDTLIREIGALPGPDDRTRQLICIAINTAVGNPRGVWFHAAMAREAGASRGEVMSAVIQNLHLSGLSRVLESLPGALEGYEKGAFSNPVTRNPGGPGNEISLPPREGS